MMSAPNHCKPALFYDKWPFPWWDLAGGHFPKAAKTQAFGETSPVLSWGHKKNFAELPKGEPSTNQRIAITASRVRESSHSKLPLFCIWKPKYLTHSLCRLTVLHLRASWLKHQSQTLTDNQFSNVCIVFFQVLCCLRPRGLRKCPELDTKGHGIPRPLCESCFALWLRVRVSRPLKI